MDVGPVGPHAEGYQTKRTDRRTKQRMGPLERITHNFFLGRWNQNRLLSRKWWLVAGMIPVAVALDIMGHPLGQPTLTFLERVIVAYLAVQGVLDWRGAKYKADAYMGTVSQATQNGATWDDMV